MLASSTYTEKTYLTGHSGSAGNLILQSDCKEDRASAARVRSGGEKHEQSKEEEEREMVDALAEAKCDLNNGGLGKQLPQGLSTG